MKKGLILGAVALVAVMLGVSFVQTGNHKKAQAQAQSKSEMKADKMAKGDASKPAFTPIGSHPVGHLTDDIKKAFMKAKPVRGKSVDREMFNGKPLLVVFFASW